MVNDLGIIWLNSQYSYVNVLRQYLVMLFQIIYRVFRYYTGPVNSVDSTDFTGPDKTHSLVLKHAM